MRRIILCTEGVNVYGYRVLVSGTDLTLFTKNPVMLWMHIRGKIIGKWKDVKIEDGKITAEPVFADTDEGRHYKKLYEDDMINMASIWVQPIEWSEEPKLRLEGQTMPTVTNWLLKEGSLVDIAGDTDAIKLVDGKNNEFKLSDFNKDSNFNQNTDMKNLALFFKLSESANEQAILEQVQKLSSEHAGLTQKLADKTQEVERLTTKKEELETKLTEQGKSEFKVLIDNPALKLTDKQKANYEKLFEKDPETATAVVKDLPSFKKLSEVPEGGEHEEDESRKTWTLADYMAKDPEAAEVMKLKDQPRYVKLFKAQYNGKEPKNLPAVE